MATKVGKLIIKRYENDKIFIDAPEDSTTSMLILAFYFDRVVHNLSSERCSKLTKGLFDATNDTLSIIQKKIKNNQLTVSFDKLKKIVSDASFGTFPFFIFEDTGKTIFEAYGELNHEKSKAFYIQTKFKPMFAKNDFLENHAGMSVLWLYDYILSTTHKERDIVFLVGLIFHMTSKYLEKDELSPLGVVPVYGLTTMAPEKDTSK